MIKLKDLINDVIKEQISTTATAGGAKNIGYKSTKTDELEKAVDTATTDYETHLKAEPDKYQWLEKGKKGPVTGNKPPKGVKYTGTKEWEKWNTSLTSKLDARDTAKDDYQTSKEDDKVATTKSQEPPAGVTSKKKKKDEND